MAYASIALYSGLGAGDPSLAPVSGLVNGLPALPRGDAGPYDGGIVAVAAERAVLDSLLKEGLPTTTARIAHVADSLESARTTRGISNDLRARSEQLGREIATKIVAWSHSDGFDTTRGRPYAPPTGLAYWVNDTPTPLYASQNQSGTSEFVAIGNPANVLQSGNASARSLILNRPKRKDAKTLPPVNMTGVTEPYWVQLRPFVLKRWDECAPPEPPAYSPDKTSALYQNADTVRTIRKTLTPEQRAIAFYWADNAGETGTPVGHWTSIASQLASERHVSAEDAARILMLTSLSQADAFIAAWGYKFKYVLIRPRTYIRRLQDSTWEPLIPTPPFPEYPSAHSTQSMAAATVLGSLIGDSVAFDDSTGLSIGNPVRHFTSFRAASEEAGISRIYGGIHFPYGNIGGRVLGKCVGEKVNERARAAGLH